MKFRSTKALLPGILGLALVLAATLAQAQTTDSLATHAAHSAGDPPAASADSKKMQEELSRLREQVRRLEQRMQSAGNGGMQPMGRGGMTKPGSISQMPSGMKMGGMRMMEHMDMSMDKMGSNPAMPAGGMGMMDDDMMGMGAMGGMNSPAAMATPSALPGFPGQSHLYHIGATDFFLDHPQHVTLTTQQQQTLAKRKQDSLLKQGELQRQIEAAEQELWQLTGSDQPQIGSIEKKVREIERLRGDKRIAFIRAVGEAAKSLSDEQRQQLTGMAPAQPMNDQAPMPMPDNNKSKNMEHM